MAELNSLTTEENKMSEEFKIVKNKTFNLYQIARDGKGLVPVVLRGSFTTPTLAENVLRTFLEKRSVTNNEPKKNNT